MASMFEGDAPEEFLAPEEGAEEAPEAKAEEAKSEEEE